VAAERQGEDPDHNDQPLQHAVNRRWCRREIQLRTSFGEGQVDAWHSEVSTDATTTMPGSKLPLHSKLEQAPLRDLRRYEPGRSRGPVGLDDGLNRASVR